MLGITKGVDLNIGSNFALNVEKFMCGSDCEKMSDCIILQLS